MKQYLRNGHLAKPLALGWSLSLSMLTLGGCGDNKFPAEDAGVASDAAPLTDADPSELQVLSTEPTANKVAAYDLASLRIGFDRAVDLTSVTPASLWAFGQWSGAHQGDWSFSEDGLEATLTPERAFIPGEVVTVTIGNLLRSAGGGSIRQGGYSFQFRVGAKPSSMSFTQMSNVSTRNLDNDPGQAYGGVASDLNLDGYPDITIVNERSEDLVVFMNQGDGSVALQRVESDYPVGIRPSPSETADLNGDGRTDLVVANIGSGVSVLLGDDVGGFLPEREFVSGQGPRGIAVLDVDGDGDLDVANSNSGGSGNISILRNDGTGVLSRPEFVDAGCAGEWGLAAADMNSDGLLDLVVGCHDDGVISVLSSGGDGTFALRSTSQASVGLWMLAVGDLNADGHADVTVAGGFADNGAVLHGSADGTLGAAKFYGTDPSTSATDIGDLDGDGDLDWITSSFGGDKSDWYFWRNDGSGEFTKMLEWDSPEDASCALLVDLDLDGDLDLGLIDESEDRLLILRND